MIQALLSTTLKRILHTKFIRNEFVGNVGVLPAWRTTVIDDAAESSDGIQSVRLAIAMRLEQERAAQQYVFARSVDGTIRWTHNGVRDEQRHFSDP
jgi:hypothetical protein